LKSITSITSITSINKDNSVCLADLDRLDTFFEAQGLTVIVLKAKADVLNITFVPIVKANQALSPKIASRWCVIS
jgi:hypothetical protein